MASTLLATNSLSRYRPAIYVLTGAVAAYAILYIHRQYVTSQPHTSLHRRNAIRRRNSRRRGGISLASGESGSLEFSGPIQHLDRLERENGDYGTFRVDVGDGRFVECPLIPSQLVSEEVLQRDMGVSRHRAQSLRYMMEDGFMNVFLAMEFPPSHVIQHENGELQYLLNALVERGISLPSISMAFSRFNSDQNFGEDLRNRETGDVVIRAARNSADEPSPTVQPPDGGDTTIDDQSVFSWRDGNDIETPTREGQNLLNLLYYIAEDQARRDGYIHRGVTCNSCGAMPIQGIRYRCANCLDYDLCETCEAMQVHIKTHLFYKVRIPAPFLGNPRQSQPVWYPGKPMMLPRSLPRHLAKRLMKETNFENTEMDALWDQFRCLANVEWTEDPNKLNMAIDRKTFDRCFVPNTSVRPPPPSLIYDRMFSFYDTNGDNLIGFEEFLKGLASFSNKSVHERLKRIFEGYDMDRDGFVERKDFLRIFRAYYTLSRELTRDMVSGMEDDFVEGCSRDVIVGSQPISSAFPGPIPPGELSRSGEGKRRNNLGDMEIVDSEGVLRDDENEYGNRNAVIGEAAVREVYGRHHSRAMSRLQIPTRELQRLRRRQSRLVDFGGVFDGHDGEDEVDRRHATDAYIANYEEWPPRENIENIDIIDALGGFVPLDEITDQVDRSRVRSSAADRLEEEDRRGMERARREGINERWARRSFYIDEEDGAMPPPHYHEDSDEGQESNEDMPDGTQSDSHAPSPRSRSSSKVRFQDDVTDNEYETRSNQSTSSRSIPVGERWGGFEVPEVEKDVGKEILYQVTQQGLNELLDLVFKPKESLIMEAHRTRAERKRWAKDIEIFVAGLPENHELKKDSAVSEGAETPDTNRNGKVSGGNLNGCIGMAESAPPEEYSSAPAEYTSEEDNDSDEDDEDVPESLFTRPVQSLDPTLPQNRPDQPDLEPFPPAPECVEDEAYESDGPSSPPPDPTLPQNRPDADTPRASGRSLHITDVTSAANPPCHSVLDQNPVYESASTSTSTSGHCHPRPLTRPRNHSLPLRLRFQQSQNTSSAVRDYSPDPPSSSSTTTTASSSSSLSHNPNRQQERIVPSPPRRPSPETLAHWCKLNQVEKEAKERGGSGAKLSFEEFAMTMQGDKGRRLGFVGTWIDMTSF